MPITLSCPKVHHLVSSFLFSPVFKHVLMMFCSGWVSNWILMSCQPHWVTSCHKQVHISKLFSHNIYQPSVKLIYKTNHFANIKHTYTNIRQIFEELVPSILPMFDDRLYSAILRSHEQIHCARMRFYMTSFIARFFEYPLKWCTYSTGMAGATWNCSRLGANPMYTIQPCSMSLHAKPHT